MKPDCYCIGGDTPHYTKHRLDAAVAAACEQLRADLDEQCRLLGMSGEREAKHLAQIERLERDAAKRESSVRYLNTNAHLEAQLAVLREFAEEVRRSGNANLQRMAVSVLTKISKERL